MDYLIVDSKTLTSQEIKDLGRVWYNDTPYFRYFYYYAKEFDDYVKSSMKNCSFKICYAKEAKSANLKIVGFLCYVMLEGVHYARRARDVDWPSYNGREAPMIEEVYVIPSYRGNKFIIERMIMELEKNYKDLFIRTYDNDRVLLEAIYNLNYDFVEKYNNEYWSIVEVWRKNCGDSLCCERNYPVLNKATCLWYFNGDCVNGFSHRCNFLLGHFKQDIDNVCEGALDTRFGDIYSAKNRDKEVHCLKCGFGTDIQVRVCPICHTKDSWADKEGHLVLSGKSVDGDWDGLRRRLLREDN